MSSSNTFLKSFNFNPASTIGAENFFVPLRAQAYTVVKSNAHEWTVRLNAPVNGVQEITFISGWPEFSNANKLNPPTSGVVYFIELRSASHAVVATFDFGFDNYHVPPNLTVAQYISNPSLITREDDILFGSDFADKFYAGQGNDNLWAGGGNDFIDGGAGDDNVRGEAGNDVLYGGDGNDILDGGGDDNTLYGGAGNDRLYGGVGTNILRGGAGNDIYALAYVNPALNTIEEFADEGVDTIETDATTFSLAAYANIENLTLFSGGSHDVTGNALDNVFKFLVENASCTVRGGLGIDTVELTVNGPDVVVADLFGVSVGGNFRAAFLDVERLYITSGSGADALTGGAYSDYFDGGAGADTMTGGGGNDTYVVGNAGDVVTEVIGGGVDTVQTALNVYTMPNAVEVLKFTGTGNFSATGTSAANHLYGGAGNDALNGAGGADKMWGGLGNDTYVVDMMTDVVTENANAGIDLVQSSATYTLSANVENLTLMGAANINGSGNVSNNILRGNGGNNSLYGNAGADTLVGNAGDDKLYGDAGADNLYGGAGHDAFVLNTAIGAGQIDRFSDFNVADDAIWLENAIFIKLAAGSLSANNFRIGSAAVDANDYIIYNKTTGALYYDADGGYSGGAVQIATLSANLALTAQDFVII